MITLRYKPVDRSLLQHPVEKRGFVTVDGADIFYRLIPAYGSSPQDRAKPIIVVINGGPGIASSAYRPLDFDYEHLDSPKNGSPNRFLFLLKSFHVLIADQRGTDGLSLPLDLSIEDLDYQTIARGFSSDTQARDYLAVIDHLIPPDQTFYLIAQSYGGMVGMQYLGLHQKRKPRGIVFSASAVPYEDPVVSMTYRREEQLKLNLALKREVPDIESRVRSVKAHLSDVGLKPDLIHSLFALLGKGVSGSWEKQFAERLEKMLTQSGAELKKELHDTGGVNLLNYVLSSANFTPGYTDRSMARRLSEKVPFEEWMFDENLTYLQEMDEPWKETLVRRIDTNPPAPTPMPSIELLRQEIQKTQLLFTAADNDAFVPAEIFKKSIEKFFLPGHTEVLTLPGGHNAIFLEKGYRAFLEWCQKFQDQ